MRSSSSLKAFAPHTAAACEATRQQPRKHSSTPTHERDLAGVALVGLSTRLEAVVCKGEDEGKDR